MTVVHEISGERYLDDVREAITKLKKVSLVDESNELLDVQPLPRKFIMGQLRQDNANTIDAKDRIAEVILNHASSLAEKGTINFDFIDAQIESVHACIEWALTRGMEGPALLERCSKAVEALEQFWWYRGHWTRATDFAERAAATVSDPEYKAKVAAMAAWFLTERGDHTKALEWADRAVDWAPSAAAFRVRGQANKGIQKYDIAEQDYLKAQGLGSTTTTHDIANLRNAQGRRDEAETLYRAEMARYRKSGDENNLAVVCRNLGALLIDTNRSTEGEPLMIEAEVLSRKIGRVMLLAVVLEVLASYRLAQGNPELARKLAVEAQSIRRRVGVSTPFAESLFKKVGLT
jgi:tetratricopeptide (TPR) repeat protein